MRKARSKVKDLPAGFRYHGLRHYFAGLLIAYRPEQFRNGATAPS